MITTNTITPTPALQLSVNRLEAQADDLESQAEKVKSIPHTAAYAVRLSDRAHDLRRRAADMRRSGSIRTVDIFPRASFLFVAPFHGYRVCVAECSPRTRAEHTIGQMIVFVEKMRRPDDDRVDRRPTLSESQVEEAVAYLFDRINDEADVTADWTDCPAVELLDLTAVAIPGGWVVQIHYGDDLGYELRRKQQRASANRVAAFDF